MYICSIDKHRRTLSVHFSVNVAVTYVLRAWPTYCEEHHACSSCRRRCTQLISNSKTCMKIAGTHMCSTRHMLTHLEKNQSAKQSPLRPCMQNALLFGTFFSARRPAPLCSALLFSVEGKGLACVCLETAANCLNKCLWAYCLHGNSSDQINNFLVNKLWITIVLEIKGIGFFSVLWRRQIIPHNFPTQVVTRRRKSDPPSETSLTYSHKSCFL